MKRKLLFRIACMFLVCCMVISVSACTSSTNTEKQPAASNASTGDTAKEETVKKAEPASSEAKSGEKKKIVFWNLYYNTQNESDKDKSKDELFVNKSAKKFEEANPDITVEVLSPPMDNYFNMLKSACVAKNGPDICMNWVGGPLMDYTQFLSPLDSYYTKDEIAELKGWDLCRQDYKPDGSIMAVPVGMNGGVYVFYYNKALFKKAKVDPERKPKTWDEFLALCADLKKGGVTPFIDGDKEGWNSAWVMGQLWYDLLGMEGILKIKEGKTKFVEDKTFKEAFNEWKKLYDLGYTNKDVMSLAQADGQAKFLAGEGAIEVGWSNLSKDVNSSLGEDAGWFPMPHIKADAPFYNTYLGGYAGYCFSVTNFSKAPDAAVKYIKYMTSKDTMDWFVDECQFDLSNNVNSKTPVFKNNPTMAWMWDFIKNTTDKPAVQWDSILQGDLAQEIYNMSGAMFGGKMTIDEGLKKFDEKFAAITKK